MFIKFLIKSKRFHTLFLLAITIFFSIYFRLGLKEFRLIDNYAENLMNNQIYSQISHQIYIRHHSVSVPERNRIIENAVSDYKRKHKSEIKELISESSESLKSHFRDENNLPYFKGMDPYYYYRFIRNIIQRGHAGEYERDNRTYSKLMTAPTEKDVTGLEREFIVYTNVWAYKFLRLFSQDLAPINVFFFMPVLFAALSAIAAFFVGKEISGKIGGFITANALILNSYLQAKTSAGFSDTDIYNVFFPLVIVLFTIKAFKADKLFYKILYMALTGFSMAIYSTAWTGWWNIFYYIIPSYLTIFLVKTIMFAKEHKSEYFKLHHLFLLCKKLQNGILLLLLNTVFFIIFFLSISGDLSEMLLKIFQGHLIKKNLTEVIKNNLWPNVSRSVAELQSSDAFETFNQLGDGFDINVYIIVILFLLGIFLILKSNLKIDYRIFLTALLVIWVAALFYATLNGIRFMMLLAIPISIGLGAGAGHSISWIDKYSRRKFKYGSMISIVFAVSLTSFLLVPILLRANEQNNGQLPIIDHKLAEALYAIRDNSEENAIINSWWDLGHPYITLSERGATSDGGNSNTPQIYWLARLFLTSNEREAVGIIRMLNCDGNKAFEKINDITNDTVTSIEHLNRLVTVGKKEAVSYLKEKGFSDEQINSILESSHGIPPESFVITDERMAKIVATWSYYGAWNFKRAEILSMVSARKEKLALETLRKYGEQDPEKTLRQIKKFSQNEAANWISVRPSYKTGLDQCTTTTENILCRNGIVVDRNENVSIKSPFGVAKPGKVVLYSDGEYRIKEQEDGENDISVLITQEGTTHRAMILSEELTMSTFTKLFYLNDEGKYFKLFRDITDVSGQRIIVWTVNWEKVLAED